MSYVFALAQIRLVFSSLCETSGLDGRLTERHGAATGPKADTFQAGGGGDARRIVAKAVALSPGNTLWLARLGQAYATVGRTREARQLLEELRNMSRQRCVSPYHMAYLYTGLGEQDEAIEWLERAYEKRAGRIAGVKGSFSFCHSAFPPEILRSAEKDEPGRGLDGPQLE